MIVSTGWGIGGEVTVNAQINPEGLETTYEIRLACSSCAPVGYSPAAGTLPAVDEVRTVTLSVAGMQPGSYRFEALARNSAGGASQSGELDVPTTPPGTCPNGCSESEQYGSETPVWSTELSNSESNATIKEYEAKQAREQQEKISKEAAQAAQYAMEEAELKQAEEREVREAAAREREEREAEYPACRVPALRGKRLTAARRALVKAHCRLGAVRRRTHNSGALYVSAQSAPPGKRLAHNAHVALWLGVKQSAAKRASA